MALVLNGSLTQAMAPMFSDAVGRTVSRNWLAFVGRGGGRLIPAMDVKQVTYEIQRGNRRTSQLVTRAGVANRLLGENQKNLDMGSYTQISRATPLSIEEFAISNEKLLEKLPGEPTTDSGVTRQFRLRYYAGVAQNEMVKAQMRLMNNLVGEGIRTGYQTAVTGDTDNLYDFYRDANNMVTLGTPWGSNPTTATPLTDLDSLISGMIARSGVMPTIALMGHTALTALLKCDQVSDFRNETMNAAFVNASERLTVPSEYQFLVDAGWEMKGMLYTWEGRSLYIFTTEALSDNSSGTPTRCMPANEVVLCNANSRLDGIFGPPETLPETATDSRLYQEWFGFAPGATPPGQTSAGIVSPEMFYLDARRNESKTAYLMRSQTAPLYVPVSTDEWGVLQNAGS
jgi:hypothetical protein